MIDHLELTVDELLLDEDNPRLGSVGSQSEALETLIRLNSNHFRNMMLSIKENGLDPGDSLYVIEAEADGDYIVLEGNRRLSALKVLFGPDVLDSTGISATMKKSLLRAASGFDTDEFGEIRCVCFEGRAEAQAWILRRHTGDMDGEGRINWGPIEIQRFTGDRSVLDVIDFVGRNADFTDDEWESTKSTIESRKSSNIARILESSPGREHIGISTTKDSDGHKTPLLSRDPKWAVSVLKQIIEDVRDGVIDSRSHNTASEIEDYFKLLPKKLQPKGKKRVVPQAFKNINIMAQAIPQKKKPSKPEPKTRGAPRVRKTLAPKKNSFQAPPSEKGKRLLREATMIDADKLTISAAFVLRAFVELSVNDYMAKKKLTKNHEGRSVADLSLSKRADLIIKQIVKDGSASNADMRGFRNNVIKKTAASSIQSLNGFVHNRYQIPTPEAVRAGWDCCVPVFEATYGKI